MFSGWGNVVSSEEVNISATEVASRTFPLRKYMSKIYCAPTRPKLTRCVRSGAGSASLRYQGRTTQHGRARSIFQSLRVYLEHFPANKFTYKLST